MLKIYPRGFVGPILDNPDAKPSKKEVSIAGATFKVQLRGDLPKSPLIKRSSLSIRLSLRMTH